MKFTEALSNTIDWFYWKPFRKLMPKQTFRYLMCGALNVIVSQAVYTLAFMLLRNIYLDLGFVVVSPHVAALGIALPVAFVVGFWLQTSVSFKKSPVKSRVQFIRYVLSSIGAVLLNYVFLKFFVEVCHIFPPLAQFVSTLIIAVYSYYMQKYYAFRGAEKE